MTILEIAWTAPALTDVSETIDFIASHDPDAARQWYERIILAVERAAEFPQAGRVVPEVARGDVRELIVGRYRVIYRIAETHIIAWAVRQWRRLLTEDIVADLPDS